MTRENGENKKCCIFFVLTIFCVKKITNFLAILRHVQESRKCSNRVNY